MDPDACLARHWAALAEGDLAEAREAARDLKRWIASGGFEPTWDADERAAVLSGRIPAAMLADRI